MLFLFRKFKRGTSIAVGILAGAAFIVLAVYGWGVPPQRMASMFVISMLFLALIVIVAMIFGLAVVLSKKLKKEKQRQGGS